MKNLSFPKNVVFTPQKWIIAFDAKLISLNSKKKKKAFQDSFCLWAFSGSSIRHGKNINTDGLKAPTPERWGPHMNNGVWADH